MSQELYNIVGLGGSLLSLAGVAIALWQIRKTRTAAEAAERAAKETAGGLSRNLLLSDLTSCTIGIEEIKTSIRAKRYDAALLRANDVARQLIQLQNARPLASPKSSSDDFLPALAQLGVLRDLLERTLGGEEKPIPSQANKILSQIGDDLNAVIGKMKFQVSE